MKYLLSLLAVLCLGLGLSGQAMAGSEVVFKPDAKNCIDCHVGIKKTKLHAYHSDCKSCHKSDPKVGDVHMAAGGKGNIGIADTNTCLSCHKPNKSKLLNWHFADHNKAGLGCNDCHGVHGPKSATLLTAGMPKMDKNSAMCASCHQNVLAKMNMASHHPVKEGGMSCSNCHDPHGGKPTTLLSKNEQCYKCHQAIRGPKVFEHAPVVDDCGLCHDPHGSPIGRLQSLSQPVLCLQCHPLTFPHKADPTESFEQQPKTLLDGSRVFLRCTNCHGAIHGSHVDDKLRR